ncbi:hypothetical protein [Streptomyces sp. NPDC046939]|uniref:hypothetical protein n=1 Tax=Streptomyces sp. NPDC046939 TaxID=3155376 RepID=UPI0033CA01AF
MSSETVTDVLRSRIENGRFETWLISSTGRSLAFATNTRRALLILSTEEGDPGERAVEPGAEGLSDGFVLSNGQHDAYPDRDTVLLGEAFRVVEHIVGTGLWPADARRVVDR